MQHEPDTPYLLSPIDPAPVEILSGLSGWLLTVEHAGRAVPLRLGDLGLPAGEIDRHIGWDPGALVLALVLRDALDATLVAQPYSRLVIDCNRPWGAPDLCPTVSDRTTVPANAGLTDTDRQARWRAIHVPFHAAVGQACGASARALISVHSYDPQRRADAAARPWPIGLLWRQPNPLADRLAHRLAGMVEARPLGLNQPYEIEDTSDYTIPVHAEPRQLPHVLLEVRNDQIADAKGVARVARLLLAALTDPET